MFLAIDIGNTNVVCGVYDEDKWIYTLRISSDLNYFEKLFALKKFNLKNVAISSVVPKLTILYKETILNLFNIESYIINYKNSGLLLEIESPKDVGVDRICNSVAAKKLYGLPAIIGDIGSATNYDVVDRKGKFIGGAISPGIETAALNLIQKAALLKEATFEVPSKVIGKNTKTNLQSGIMYGAIDVIDSMFNRINKEAGWINSNNIITGGFGGLISPHLNTKHIYNSNLTLEGIRFIFLKK